MPTLILLRHGESTWNKQNKFTGWTDVPLSDQGVKEAMSAGRVLKKFKIELVFTSVLKRALQTTEIVLEQLKRNPLVVKSWRLNEKHYGALQGLNKKQMATKYGEEQVHAWRRVYDCRPPALKLSDKRHPRNSALYKEVKRSLLPATESLKDTVVRVMPFWKEYIAPALKSNQVVLVSAHGNSLRAIIKHLDKISDKKIADLNIPTGIPLVYELDEQLRPIHHYYLGDKKRIEKMIAQVSSQGRAT